MCAKRNENETRRKYTRRSALGRMGAGLAAAGALPDNALAQQGNTMATSIQIPAWYYKHHDADFDLEVPEAGFGGWAKDTLEFSGEHTAVVSMHAWDAGTLEEFPGWWRVVPYIPRANAIARDIYPGLLATVRASSLPLFHVVGGGDYYKELPGYKRAVELAGPEPAPLPKVASDPIRDRAADFKRVNGYPTKRNEPDIQRGFKQLDFPEEARPQGDEGVAENGHQLYALCKEHGINHLVYLGFAINWCLLLSPGGMAEMQKYGLMCSALRQATTAVENKDSAEHEWCKELALWRVALAFGFVFDVDDLVAALK